MGNIKSKPHHLEDDISPLKRCEKCHQPFSFGKCDCKPNKLKKNMKTKAPKKTENKNPVKEVKENVKKNLVGIRPSPKMRKQLKSDFNKRLSLKQLDKDGITGYAKSPEYISFEEYLDKNFGKVGTIKRAMNDKLIALAYFKLNQKQFTNSDMVMVYNEAQALALKTKKYTGISGYKKIIEKITKNNKK